MDIIYYNNRKLKSTDVIFDTAKGLLHIIRMKQNGEFECLTENSSALYDLNIDDEHAFSGVTELLKNFELDDIDAVETVKVIIATYGRLKISDFPQISQESVSKLEFIVQMVRNNAESFHIVCFNEDFRTFSKGKFYIAKRCVHDGLVKVKDEIDGSWCYVPEEYVK